MPANIPAIGPQPIYSYSETQRYDGGPGDYMNVEHSSSLALNRATISLSFTMDGTIGKYALVSKDSNGRNEGDFTVWIDDGELKVTFESANSTKTLRVPDLLIEDQTEYHFALSFGQGLSIWLNGELVATDPEYDQGISANTSDLVVGGTRAWTSSSNDAHSLFRGEIGDVHIYDRQLAQGDILALAASVSPELDDAARMARDMEALAPTFAQLHHGSLTLENILDDYGVSDHGHIMRPLSFSNGNSEDNAINGTAGDDGMNGGRGDDLVNGEGGNDILQGDYGNDTLLGSDGNDILDGGHGEDSLNGGDGNDLLISRSDGREPTIAQAPGYAPNQRIPANDVLTGGDGADIFYFQTLINARREFLEEHTQTDGTINWHGVAGENNNYHDHWVDHIGHDVITDFSRLEGDRIVIEGHTTYVKSIEYGDANGDGIMDYSLISLYSDQGSGGGAHDDDDLGSIMVYGDLVQMSDIETTAAPAYGIVDSVVQLGEALSPFEDGTSQGPIQPPANLISPSNFALLNGEPPVFAMGGNYNFQPEHRAPLVFDHNAAMDLNAGTISFSFTATNLRDYSFLFSKDAKGMGDGGHLSSYINENGDLVVRIQDGEDSHYLVAQGAIQEGVNYDIAFSFGAEGAQLFINGVRVAFLSGVTTGLGNNTEALIIGATGWSSTAGTTDNIWGHFDGLISDFAVYSDQISGTTAPDLAAMGTTLIVDHLSTDGTFWMDSSDALMLTAGSNTYNVGYGFSAVEFNDLTLELSEVDKATRTADTIVGTASADVLVGLGGNDTLHGGEGNDVFIGGAGFDTIDGGEGDDSLAGGYHADLLLGGNGNDLLDGGAGLDNIFGDAGNDTLIGQEGNDRLFAGDDDDELHGGLNEDFLFGEEGNDTLNGDAGFDMLDGGAGDDLLNGGSQADNLFGGLGNDTMNGDDGFDRLFGGFGDDLAYGGEGTDGLFGEGGNDTLYGGTENDRFFGGTGNDYIDGGADDDVIFAGSDFDTIIGGSGNDTLSGNFNADMFMFADGFGNDIITDFEALNDNEVIDLSAVSGISDWSDLVSNHMSQDGSDVVIDDLAGNTIRLLDVDLANLDANDFVF